MGYFKSPIDNRLARYDHLIVHCTATKAEQVNVDAEWVDQVHKDKGWSGCGYHAVITRSGDVQTWDLGFKARPFNRTGAHVGGCGQGWNSRSLGVTLAGGLDRDGRPECNFTGEQFDALENFIDDFLEAHPDPDNVEIMGHRDLIRFTRSSPKACPCFEVVEFLSERNIMTEDEDSAIEDDSSPLLLPERYEVKSGDSLWKISRLFGISVDSIREKNNLQTDVIHPGQELLI